MTRLTPEPQRRRRIGAAGWFAIAILGGFLAASIAYAVHAWNALGGVGISSAGWVFLALGVVFTLLVGGGLMGLVFYSSRNDYDRYGAGTVLRRDDDGD